MEWDMAMDWKEVPGDWVPASAHPGMGTGEGGQDRSGQGGRRRRGPFGGAPVGPIRQSATAPPLLASALAHGAYDEQVLHDRERTLCRIASKSPATSTSAEIRGHPVTPRGGRVFVSGGGGVNRALRPDSPLPQKGLN